MTEENDDILFRKKEEKPKVRTKVGQWFFDLWQKILEFLNNQFTGIFERDKIFYTLIFLVGAIIIAFFSLAKKIPDPLDPTQMILKNPNVAIAVDIITVFFVLGFLFLMICTFIPALSKQLFEKEEWFMKIIITVFAFVFSLTIAFIWALLGDDASWTFQILRFSQLMPYIFIFIFLGWNILQIHFLKDGINIVSNKVDKRLIIDQVDPKKKNIWAIFFLVISLIVPIMAHVFTVWGFWARSQSLTDPDPTRFIAWVVVIGIVFLILDAWQIWLFVKSKQYGAVNVYSSFFYLLISLIVWFRSFGFITSFLNAISSTGSNVFNALGNILLVILTAVFVLKMIASRVKKTKKMNENAIPFLVFGLTIMYIAGQVVMIIGSVGTTQNHYMVNLTNNSILLISSVVYYLWYSQYILQRKEYIKRTLYTVEEVKGVMKELAENIKESSPNESDKIDSVLEKILDENKIESTNKE